MHSVLKATLLLALFAVGPAMAQEATDFPKQPIRIVTGSSAGSGSDIVARYIGLKLTPLLGQTIIVENKPGAAGTLGTAYVAREKPDGYTLTVGGASTHMLSAALNPKLSYDPVKDFATIGQIGTAGILLIANKNFPGNSLKDIVAMAKAKPGSLQYASWGNGSTGQFCGEVFNQLAGVKLEHIPYKSIPQVITDVEAGHMQLGFSDISSGTAFVKAGKVKGIATCGSKSPALPNVTSYSDQGIPFDRTFRWGLYAPKGTPKPIVDRLSAALKNVLEQPDVVARLLELGITAAFTPGEELANVTARDIEAWKVVARDANLKAD